MNRADCKVRRCKLAKQPHWKVRHRAASQSLWQPIHDFMAKADIPFVVQFGALAANIVLGKISDRSKFYYTAVAAGIGALVTMLFIPEVTGLDLSEGDKRWEHLRSGRIPLDAAQSRCKGLTWLSNL